MNNLPLFFEIDEFWRFFEPLWNQHLLDRNCKKRNRARGLSLSEVMTILVLFHKSGFRTLKQFHLEYVCRYLRAEFPNLVGYNRFALVQAWRARSAFGVFANQTWRLHRHFLYRFDETGGLWKPANSAASPVYGYRPARQNDFGLVLRFQTAPRRQRSRWTSRLASDARRHRRPVAKLAQRLFGKLFGDLGCLSEPLKILLHEQNLELVTKLKRNMKNQFLNLSDKLLLRKRAIIETIFDQLKTSRRSSPRGIAHSGTFWSISRPD